MNCIKAEYKSDSIRWLEDYVFTFVGEVFCIDLSDEIWRLKIYRMDDNRDFFSNPSFYAKELFADWMKSETYEVREEYRRLYRDLTNRPRKDYPTLIYEKGSYKRILYVRSKMTPEELIDLDMSPWFEHLWKIKSHPSWNDNIEDN